MGYFINNISKEPAEKTAQVSLSGNPNFVQFESKGGSGKPVEISINVLRVGYYLDESKPNDMKFINVTKFTILEKKTNKEHVLKGTSNIAELDKNTFYIGPQQDWPIAGWPQWRSFQVAESLKYALQQNDFIGTNFDITLPPAESTGELINRGNIIKLKSKGSGEDYAFKITADDTRLYEEFFTITGNPESTTNDDSISEGYSPAEIQLELYRDTGVFLGESDKPNDENMGTYVNTFSKAYFGNPLWFNINVLDTNKYSTNFLKTTGTEKEFKWFDTNTIRDFRFIAKRFINSKEKYENSAFYYSDVFYIITGYDRTLAKNDLSEYVYNTAKGNVIKPLTSQPELTHIKGQVQYFNFIFADPDRKNELGEKEYKIGLKYRLYSSSNRFIAEIDLQGQDRTKFEMVNTIKLDIDQAIGEHKNTAIVETALYRSDKEEPISEPLRFRILPDCLYKINDFAFLNHLGGWSSFNFSGNGQTDFQTKASTYYQTHTPDKGTNSEIESVYGKNVTEYFTVQTMPVTHEICEWLKELSTSKAVYELRTGRYIIVDNLNIKPNTKDELFRLDMKYHYSDSYNAVIE